MARALRLSAGAGASLAVALALAAAGLAGAAGERGIGVTVSAGGRRVGDAGTGGDASMIGGQDGAQGRAWVDLALAPPFVARAGYQRPQYRVVEGYVSFRGWLTTDETAAAGSGVFRVPPEAWPTRAEQFKVTFKGEDRLLSVDKEGNAALQLEMQRGQWLPLVSFAYNSQIGEVLTNRFAVGEGGGTAEL